MNKFIKGTLKFLLQILAVTAIVMAFDIGMRGMYLIGVPKPEKLERVTVSYPAVTEEEKVLTDPEQMELAVKLTGFLRYAPFQRADGSGEPLIALTYETGDGKTVQVRANRTTVWWKGSAYALKDDETFVNLTEGIFFLDDLQKQSADR
ncbi:MAG: hypothetical protein Q4F17_04150 [Eubacteriales bacterium]|nr:hypothetical protein [Eubacteriales bacterium]